jgi:hypothetical protein
MRYLHFLEPLDWTRIPSRALAHEPPIEPLPYAPFLAACLVKVDQHIRSMSRLRQYLVDHPALTWVLGFPLVPSSVSPWGFDVEASLPSQRHFARMLRTIPNDILQGLLDSSVTRLQEALPPDVRFGEAISLDTKHILAWVKENNPKAYVDNDDRYDKTKQPTGDPDCRLGCKKRRNQYAGAPDASFTPTTDPVPASTVKVGTFYWGYATGVVATKVPGWGEFVLAEYPSPSTVRMCRISSPSSRRPPGVSASIRITGRLTRPLIPGMSMPTSTARSMTGLRLCPLRTEAPAATPLMSRGGRTVRPDWPCHYVRHSGQRRHACPMKNDGMAVR